MLKVKGTTVESSGQLFDILAEGAMAAMHCMELSMRELKITQEQALELFIESITHGVECIGLNPDTMESTVKITKGE